MISVQNHTILNSLIFPKENDIALVEDEQKIYIYQGGEWVEYDPEDKKFGISLLELNSMLITQLPELNKVEIENARKKILDYVTETDKLYYMLLSNELRYYTLFHCNNDGSLPIIEEEVITCVQELGAVKSVELNEDGVIEIWVTIEDKSYPLYFFDYSKGVIECQ